MKMLMTVAFLFSASAFANHCTITFANERATTMEAVKVFDAVIKNRPLLLIRGYRLISMNDKDSPTMEAQILGPSENGGLNIEIHSVRRQHSYTYSTLKLPLISAVRDLILQIPDCHLY